MWLNGKEWLKAEYIFEERNYFPLKQSGRIHLLPHSLNYCLFLPHNEQRFPPAFVGYMFPRHWFNIIDKSVDNTE